MNQLYRSLEIWSSTYKGDLGRMPNSITDHLMKVAKLAALIDDGFGDFINPVQYPDRIELRRELASLDQVLNRPSL